jgi:cytochrome c-type biogenesis protein CcmH
VLVTLVARRRRRARGLVTLLAVALVLGAAGSVARAAEPSVEARARALFHEHLSPYCPGLLLSDCSSRPAATLRDEIRRDLASGATDDEVRAELRRRFGERILAAPPGRGFGLVAWLVPPAAVLAASAAVALWLSTRSRRPAPAAPPAAPVDPRLRARLEAELTRS